MFFLCDHELIRSTFSKNSSTGKPDMYSFDLFFTIENSPPTRDAGKVANF